MKRKVQQLGSSTLAVTLPAEWARRHQIEKGDEVIVQRDEHGGSLLVVPEQPTVEDAAATVDADALAPAALERAVVSQYVLGRQLIRIESSTPLSTAAFDAVRSAERRLMGLGVVEQDECRVTVRCSVAPGDFDLPTLLGRLGRTEAALRADALSALVEGDADRARGLDAQYAQVEKLFYLFLRLVFVTYRNPQLNEAVGLETGFPLIGYRSVAQDLLLMADLSREVGALVGDSVPDETTVDLLAGVGDALAEATATTVAAVTTPDYDATEEARAGFDRVAERVAALNDHLDAERPEPLLVLQRAAVLLERSAKHASDSLAVATHLAFRSGPDLVTTGES
jgi:phosphate uptake regulator